MHIGQQEMRELEASSRSTLQSHYRQLADGEPDEAARAAAAVFLHHKLAELAAGEDDLPQAPAGLAAWMEDSVRSVHDRYGAYLAARAAGAPRRFFSNRSHALYVLRNVAPTKLVDGAWLYGLVRHRDNMRLADLVRTYVEELGEGAPDKNHVVVYRQLLARHALDPLDDLPDALYEQGLIQLALGWNVDEFLPEVVGFNLGYEQLPLHLLITAYELNELGLDPYYFTLHVTVDNADTGHARRACQAVLDMLPRLDDGGAFWRRVRAGYKLACAGVGTQEVVAGFDIRTEALRILAHKARSGSGVHSDYCRVGGRSINDWLAQPAEIGDLVSALEGAGWIRFGEPVENSRFWSLLQGDRAEMFGVFSSYELQVLHDWIRGAASVDGRAYAEAPPAGPRRRATFRAMQRHAATSAESPGDAALDPDLLLLREQLGHADAATRHALITRAMSPGMHWTPAGLEATRLFCAAS